MKAIEAENEDLKDVLPKNYTRLDNDTLTVGLELVGLLDDAVEHLVVYDETKRRFQSLAGNIVKLYKAILPDPKASEFAKEKNLFTCISDKIRALTPPADISGIMGEIAR